MLTATAAFVAMTGFVKLLREDGLDTPQVMFWRMAPGLPWVLLELRVRRIAFAPRVPGLVLARCVFGICAMATNFYAVRALTLVQHNVLHLLQPVFVALLAPFLLHERLRPAAFVALALALFGAIAVIAPTSWPFLPGGLPGGLPTGLPTGLPGGPTHDLGEIPLVAAAAGVSAALFSALAHMWVRRATEHDAPELVVFHFTVAVSVIAAVWMLLGSGAGLPASLGVAEASWKIAGMAGFGLVGQLLMTRAYDRTQAPAVAVVAYASIPLSFALDVVFWDAVGGLATALGAGAMVLAGVLLVRGGGAGRRLKSPSAA